MPTLSFNSVPTTNTLDLRAYLYLDNTYVTELAPEDAQVLSVVINRIQIGNAEPTTYTMTGGNVIISPGNVAYIQNGTQAGQLRVTYATSGQQETSVVFQS